MIQVQTQYLEQLANVPAKVPDGEALLSLAKLLPEVDRLSANLTIRHLSEDQAATHACYGCLKNMLLNEVLTIAIIVMALL